jgi:regulatory protein
MRYRDKRVEPQKSHGESTDPQAVRQNLMRRLAAYCARQERCASDVKQKIAAHHIPKAESDKILTWLREEGYLDESRYARRFAEDHFRNKKWGRLKIRQELKQKLFSNTQIQEALATIAEADYLSCLDRLLHSKWKSLDKSGGRESQRKLVFYLQQKGYELPLILQSLRRSGE